MLYVPMTYMAEWDLITNFYVQFKTRAISPPCCPVPCTLNLNGYISTSLGRYPWAQASASMLVRFCTGCTQPLPGWTSRYYKTITRQVGPPWWAPGVLNVGLISHNIANNTRCSSNVIK